MKARFGDEYINLGWFGCLTVFHTVSNVMLACCFWQERLAVHVAKG